MIQLRLLLGFGFAILALEPGKEAGHGDESGRCDQLGDVVGVIRFLGRFGELVELITWRKS